ncbi:MAG: peptidase [Chloroflexi bacterium]|nr:MAG: peptidase [Chloroflexota bacterium]
MAPLRRMLAISALALALAAVASPGRAAGDHLVRLHLDGEIDPVSAGYVEAGLSSAADGGAAAVVLEIDSPGGDLASMDRIIKAILGSRLPVLTYVAPGGARAGSAATFVTLAADVAAMAPNTNIGAASVVSSTGQDLPPTLARKVTNDAVARIRDLAQSHARNADWAESAVRNAASIGVAQAVGMTPPVVDLEAPDLAALLAAVDTGHRADGHLYRHNGAALPRLGGLPVQESEMNLGQRLLELLGDPNIVFVLFTLGFFGIVAEFFHPNFFTGTLGAVAIVLAWVGSNSLPLNVGGLLLIGLGIGLFILELHVTSFGLLTIGGVVSFVFGAFALFNGVDLNRPVEVHVSPIIVGVVIVFVLVYLWTVMRGVIVTRRRPAGALPIAAVMGTIGQARTLIAPSGIAYAGGETWSARSRSGEIRPGSPLRVVGAVGLELIVEAAPDASASESAPKEE